MNCLIILNKPYNTALNVGYLMNNEFEKQYGKK